MTGGGKTPLCPRKSRGNETGAPKMLEFGHGYMSYRKNSRVAMSEETRSVGHKKGGKGQKGTILYPAWLPCKKRGGGKGVRHPPEKNTTR